MRKSLAPSQRNKSNFGSSNICSNELQIPSRLKCFSSQLDKSSLTDILPTSDNSTTEMFHVVYGKPSKKKHKTWDGDGVLEIRGNSGVLKDPNGKVVGHSTNLKKCSFVEGTTLFVGSKQVEIVEKYDENLPKCEQTIVNCDSGGSKRKSEEINAGSVLKKSRRLSRPEMKPVDILVMPSPVDEHQWQCNPNNLPVTPVTVAGHLCKVLRKHQREGVIFLYNCLMGFRDFKYKGAILADEMGLGKTLQCIALVWTLLNSGPYGGIPLLKKVLIVAPSSLVQNWKNEFVRWIGLFKLRPYVVDSNNRPKDYPNSRSPILIISYEMFVKSYDEVVSTQFDLLICDEGHRLKNSNNLSTRLLNQLMCECRILLTGTPIQNDLQEFYNLVNFVNPGVLGTPSEYFNNFEKPILASKEPTSKPEIVQMGAICSEELNRQTKDFILRRTQQLIGKYLPQKTEYVVFCKLTQFQKHLYSFVVDFWNKRMNGFGNVKDCGIKHLSVIMALKKICNHPFLLNTIASDDSDESLNYLLRKETKTEFNAADASKMVVVESVVKCTLQGESEKLILVSNFTQTLDLFVKICNKSNCQYLRFDGSTPVTQREVIVRKFNDPSSKIKVLLLSSKAGGVGLNLIGASRLILYDSDWNPATDSQAMARIWREGQTKNVHVYRLLTSGTIEEKIFQRQLKKTGLSDSVIDVSNASSFKLSNEELRDLFNFTGLDECLTHVALNCCCSGDGEILEPLKEDEKSEERDCQILLHPVGNQRHLRMNHLLQWEHYKAPFNEALLVESYLSEIESINFVFQNRVVMTGTRP